MAEVVHISSHPVKVGSEIRQRCIWCGELLVEQDLRFVAMQLNEDGSTSDFPVWPTNSFIGVDGYQTYVVEPNEEDPDKAPPNFCAAPDDLSELEKT